MIWYFLADLLSQYNPNMKDCLELFARNLIPEWTSWGNEVNYYTLDFVSVGLQVECYCTLTVSRPIASDSVLSTI